MDYISRETLKERLEHKYILSDLEHPNPRLYRHTDIMDVIDTIPSADVEEVIRCKECVHWNAETKGCKRNSSVQPWWENDFCNYGEKMEGNE